MALSSSMPGEAQGILFCVFPSRNFLMWLRWHPQDYSAISEEPEIELISFEFQLWERKDWIFSDTAIFLFFLEPSKLPGIVKVLVHISWVELNIIQLPHFIEKVAGTWCECLVKKYFSRRVLKARYTAWSATVAGPEGWGSVGSRPHAGHGSGRDRDAAGAQGRGL